MPLNMKFKVQYIEIKSYRHTYARKQLLKTTNFYYLDLKNGPKRRTEV